MSQLGGARATYSVLFGDCYAFSPNLTGECDSSNIVLWIWSGLPLSIGLVAAGSAEAGV